ncbi:MAG: hypothetical protein WC545_00175 [Patescibacteria group bacterium]
MKKIKGFLFSENKVATAIFGFLAVAVFALVFGPNLYAQFMRQTGSAGWGYGYGYGYGYGSGFDGGTLYGYKTDFTTSATDAYGYGYGYGYRASADSVTVGSTSYQEVPAASIASAVPTLFTLSGSDPTAVTSLTAADNIAFTATATAGDVQVLIPSGTVITNSGGTAFDATTLTSADKLSSITASTISSSASVKGAIEFGATSETLYFSAPVTVKIPVDSSLNGTTLYIKRSADSGSTWVSTGLTVASTDTCSSGVGSDPATAVVVSGGYATVYTCRASYFATYSSSSSGSSSSGGSRVAAAYCTSVTYGEYAAACFGGYQYRNVLSSTPNNCTLTAAQQEATKKVCGAADQPTVITETPAEVGMDSAVRNAFVMAEKGLVKRVNAALAKRLAGRILLQVQAKGEAWYVNPVNSAKYYLGRPADAFGIMRGLGLGVSEKDYASWNGKAPSRLAGRILLRVQAKGEAYYVNPLDLKLHYLGRPADAFAIMRNLGLGITNDNLRQISVEDVK